MYAEMRKLAVFGAIVAATLLCFYEAAHADDSSERAYILKAAFVYNFGKFVDWPASAFASDTSPLKVCVHGQAAHAGMAAVLRDKSVAARPIVVIDTPGADAVSACHIVFFADDRESHREALKAYVAAGALTVGDSDDFIRTGGMVGLVTVENKIRFEVNLATCRRAGLRISASLLRLAKTVVE